MKIFHTELAEFCIGSIGMHQLTNSLDRQGFGNFCQASHNHLLQTDSQVNASLQKPELAYTDICKE